MASSSSPRVAIVADVDLPVRRADHDVRAADRGVRDAGRLAELEARARQSGCEVVELAACEVVVAALTADSDGLADRTLPDRPIVASIERRPGYPEAARSSVRSRADAFCVGTTGLAEAIRWAANEDRAARTRGQPRLTVIGSGRDDFGGYRLLGPDPTTIGRSLDFAYHPQRPDRVPTPVGTIARVHARVRYVDGVVSVIDLQSTHGTLVIREAGAVLLCPQERRSTSGHSYGPPASAWLTRDSSEGWVELGVGNQLQLHGFWRFRVDGDTSPRIDDTTS